MGALRYDHGLQRLTEHAYAYFQPDGGWGWSNSGLIVGRGESLLVDTLFDLKLTRAMLDAMRPVLPGPIRRLVNTHHNGDHCYGNELVTGAEIIAHRACAEEMVKVPPALLQQLLNAWGDAPEGRYVREAFGAFDFSGITLTPPTTTFEERLSLEVDGYAVDLIYLGPAHTAGDTIAHFPEEGVVFAGDLLFHRCTPIIWEGTLERWNRALDVIMGLGAQHIVPGHGPLADNAGVKTQQDYFTYVWERARDLHAAGVPAAQAVERIELGPYAEWGDWERIAANVMRFYQLLDGQIEAPVSYQVIFQGIARTYYARQPA
jgi:glyoxylase-like metal-dependent hydrolase (beta-lactamase superfamily II)